MAKAKTPSQKKAYDALNKRLLKYVAMVRAIYDNLNLEASKIASHTPYDAEGEKPFKFKDYPATTDSVKKLQQRFVNDLGTVIMSGTSQEWKNSNELQDLLADKVIKTYGAKRGTTRTKKYYQVNNDALKAFQQRRINGMNLSQNLWNQAENYKQGLEFALSSAIEKGMSAVTLSKRVSRYLNDFESLRKDYKERYGKAVDCHDCEYRSIRLARSEINMAYRTAEQTRWQQMDFILGYEIKLSHSHPCHDICDDLKGRYPKNFKWVGWHPNDLCYVVPIIKSEEKWWEDEDNRGTDNDEITELPDNFKQWAAQNKERIDKAESRGTLPYFVRDNRQSVRLAVKQGGEGGMKGGHLGRKDENEAYIAYSKKGNSVTILSEAQKENRNQLADMLGIDKSNISPFMSHDEANGRAPNIDHKKGDVYMLNCQSCVVAYEVRRRGLNVTALGYDASEGSPSKLLSNDCTLAFQNASVKVVNPKGKQLSSKMINEATKEEGRYFFGWDKSGVDGHILIAERLKDNSLVFYDPQDGHYWSINDIFANSAGFKVTAMRVDVLLLKNEFIKDLIRMS